MDIFMLETIIGTALFDHPVYYSLEVDKVPHILDNIFTQQTGRTLTNVFMRAGLYIPYKQVIVHSIPLPHYHNLIGKMKREGRMGHAATDFMIGLALDDPELPIRDIFPSLKRRAIRVGTYR